LLLADEPTGNLDSLNAASVLDLLFSVQASSGACLVLVTHEEAVATRCERIIRLKDGSIVEDVRSDMARAPIASTVRDAAGRTAGGR
jgi:putative ABC transport system ATP-binding protein